MSEFFHIMTLPFLACLILAGIHAYLGLHVIQREVIFVDLSLAQIAALGSSLALLLGHGIDSAYSYWMSLGCTMVGAAVFSLTRIKSKHVPQEAIIGIVYAVSAALMILVHSRCGEGDEHIRQAMVGNILLVRPSEVLKIFLIYSAVGVFHFLYRRQFFMISKNPNEAAREGVSVRLWDFIFYVSFGFVVTSSVKIAGVLLVFSFLIVPAVCAALFSEKISVRLWLGWAVGFAASVLGIAVSYFCDFPTGASVVCMFGLVLVFLAIAKRCFH